MSKGIHRTRYKRYVILCAILLVCVLVAGLALNAVLYRAIFNYKSGHTNEYSLYASFSYISSGENKEGTTPKDTPITIDVLYDDKRDGDVVVYFHGNSGRLTYILDYLNEHNSFVAPAYPGYHRSTSKPSVEGTLESLDNLLPEIEERLGENIRLHLIGHSLGTQTASYWAHVLREDNRLKTLSLVAGFPSIKKLCQNSLDNFSFMCVLANKSFDAAEYLRDVGDIRVYVYHLPEDERIPYEDGRLLYDLIPLPEGDSPIGKSFHDLYEGDHGNFNIARVVQNALQTNDTHIEDLFQKKLLDASINANADQQKISKNIDKRKY